MAVNQVDALLKDADEKRREYEILLEQHIHTIKSLEAECRLSKEGHVWLKVAKDSLNNHNKYNYLEICQCCGFYCISGKNKDINLVKKALTTEIVLSEQKENIRKKLLDEYGEPQEKLDSLKLQLNILEEEIKEILLKCYKFLGEDIRILPRETVVENIECCNWD